MKASTIRIGKSQGVRFIREARRPREGWADAFRAMAQAGDDRLIDGDLPPQTRFDEDEWAW